MITNLPPKFPVTVLQDFDFGDAEAQMDGLLLDCAVSTAPMAEVLADKKDIVLGYRGTGKSALVRLLAEGRLRFKTTGALRSTVLALNEEFPFRLIADMLGRSKISEKNQKLNSRVVWELLVIYRALQHIKEQVVDADLQLVSDLKDLESALGVAPHKPNFFEVLMSTKKTIGVKIDANAPSETNFYAGLEPVPIEQHQEQPISLKLVDYKRHLEKFLQERGITLYILFDRLDDFVAQEDYETQRLLMHGLLTTQQDYRHRYRHIKVKAFIRTDLFRKLDISDFGADKILTRCIYLAWTPSAIKQFIATRVAANLMQSLKLDSLMFEIDETAYEMTRDKLAELKTIRKSMEGARFWQWRFWVGLWRLLREFEVRKPNEGRVRNSSDVVNEALITSILPTEVPHVKANGTEGHLNIFEYFETHFQFGHGETTPRAMLAYLNHLLTETNKYYLQNDDIAEVEKNENGEYPLFVKLAVRPLRITSSRRLVYPGQLGESMAWSNGGGGAHSSKKGVCLWGIPQERTHHRRSGSPVLGVRVNDGTYPLHE
jgi:hypothetical protein